MGAYLNVKINASGVEDKDFVNKKLSEGLEIETKSKQLEDEILETVNEKIAS